MPRRLYALDGLRGLAALAVVVLHVWMWTDANRPDRPELLDRAIGELRVAVTLFFVLSGFLLARPWLAAARGERPAPTPGRFALRRLARIGPGYWLAVAGSLLLLHGSGHPRDVAPADVPKFLLFASNLFGDTRNQLDPPMWSLHVEASFYAALPLIGLALVAAGRRRSVGGPLGVCATLVAATLAWCTAAHTLGWPPEVTWTLPTFLGTFACGIAAAALVDRPRPGRVGAGAVAAAGALLVLANGVWHSAGTGTLGHVIGDLPAAAGFAALIWAIARHGARPLASAPLRALGAISYGVYLWHMPVLFWLGLRGAFPEHAGPALARVVPLTLALATASWFLVERPALALGRPRRRSAPESRARAHAQPVANRAWT
jgi:peptidoglycan/LPS O-acetylase OafA/YrhL